MIPASYDGTNPAHRTVMRDIKLFVLAHLSLIGIAVLGSM